MNHLTHNAYALEMVSKPTRACRARRVAVKAAFLLVFAQLVLVLSPAAIEYLAGISAARWGTVLLETVYGPAVDVLMIVVPDPWETTGNVLLGFAALITTGLVYSALGGALCGLVYLILPHSSVTVTSDSPD
ncbi:MAG: hypothetical protein KDA31_08175 [Phycisphaerales bacterium]|nr:hypothetical protein [Phycisphaerales bacterium]MCB9835886.1 hypothetical protein [Phycisphaera sp.]